MIEETTSEIKDIFDLLNPETKFCILIKSFCKKGKVLKDELIERASVELESCYKNYDTAKRMVKRHLEKFEGLGLVKIVYEKNSYYVELDKLSELKGLGLVEIGRTFSNKAISISFVLSFVAFLVSLFSIAYGLGKIEYVFITLAYFIMMIVVYFSYEDSFVFK